MNSQSVIYEHIDVRHLWEINITKMVRVKVQKGGGGPLHICPHLSNSDIFFVCLLFYSHVSLLKETVL